MSWNYRILAIEQKYSNGEISDDIYLEVGAVYYDKKGKPNGYSDIQQRTQGVGGDSIKELKKVLKLMKEALDKPILWSGDKFPKKYIPKSCKIKEK